MNFLSECELSFETYQVNKIEFIKKDIKEKNNSKIELTPQFNAEFAELEKGKFSVKLLFDIASNKANEEVPFSLSVEMEGWFTLKNGNENLIRENAVAVLFPYLRALISNVMVNANLPPLILPIINLAGLFDKENNKDEN